MNEVWKEIKGFEGLYQVSNFGHIKSVERHAKTAHGMRTVKEKQLILIQDKDGYLKVCLSKNNIRKNFSVHRLVATAFLNNPNHYPSINHIDENKKNNSVSNLEFCSIQYNNNFNGGQFRRAETKKKPIIQILNGNIICEWKSATDACRHLGIKQANIWGCLNGRRKTAGGYSWKYK